MKLEGINVVDLSMFLPGPHVTQMMCDHGADVVRIEPPPDGEPSRNLGPKRNGTTPWFRNTHRGKRSICLNLKSELAKEIVYALVGKADVVVESFRPDVLDRLGLSYSVLNNINRRIVVCSITAYGQTGPHRLRPAHDLSIQAASGLLSVNLDDNGRPTLPGVPAADMAASLMAFGAIMMALYRREKTGAGDYIDISMLDSLMGWTQNVIGPPFAEGRSHDVKNERGWGGRAFYNVYETADGGFITLSGNEPRFVSNLLQALHRPDFIELALSDPGAHQQPLIEFFSETFASRSLDEWSTYLEELDVCFGPVLNIKQAFESEQASARQMLLCDEHGNSHVGVPIKYFDEPATVRFKAPELNEDAKQILHGLNYSNEQIEALTKDGALLTTPESGSR